MRRRKIILTALFFSLSILTFGASTGERPWQVKGDIDCDNLIETITYTPDLPGNDVYPWRAFRLTGSEVARVQMGIENLRETVYLKGKRILDEGYWYGENEYDESKHYATLYNTKETYEDEHGAIITRWEFGAAVLKRITTIEHNLCLLTYRIWIKTAENIQAVPDGEVCMGVLWHNKPETGGVDESMIYIINRIAGFHSQTSGIVNPDVTFRISYSFDDTVKALNDFNIIDCQFNAVLGWDGMSPPEYYIQGIHYEDEKFRPDTPAIWGTIHTAGDIAGVSQQDNISLSVKTGRLDENMNWRGVGPGGKYTQLVNVIYRCSTVKPEIFIRGDPNKDGIVNITDLFAIARYLFMDQDLSCYDAADVNDDGYLTFEDVVHLAFFLFMNEPYPPFPPFPEPGVDPTPDNISCNNVDPPEPGPVSTKFVLSLEHNPIIDPGNIADTVNFILNLSYEDVLRATQAHAAIQYTGLKFVSAKPSESLPEHWYVRTACFPTQNAATGMLGLTLYNTGSRDPENLQHVGLTEIPAGPIITIAFTRTSRTYDAKLERYVGQDNLYCYSGVGINAGPFIPSVIRSQANYEFKRADANLDFRADLADVVMILKYLFNGKKLRCLDAADTNDDGTIDISDPVYLLKYLFNSGSPPPIPFPGVGPDPTMDKLDCKFYPPYEPIEPVGAVEPVAG